MKMQWDAGRLLVLGNKEIEAILGTAFDILGRAGVQVENEKMLCKFAESGADVDFTMQRVLFSRSFLEDFLSTSETTGNKPRDLEFTAGAEIYQGYFLDPEDEQFKEWNEEHLFKFIKTARGLKNITGVYMLGCPVREVNPRLQPLYEKLYCWKYGLDGGSAIWDTSMCDRIYEMYQVYAGETGREICDLFNGTVYVISPLKLGSIEAEQFMYFYSRGLRVGVGANGSLGGGYPVTLAGGLALNLAENLFIGILNRIFFGEIELGLGCAVAVTDMSTGALQYGRPEKSVANIAMAQIAGYLGARFRGHCGLSDAKVPGNEAGVQKTLSAIFTAMACGHANIAAGLLSTDEVFSPVQMILDDEITGALKRIAQGMEIDEESLCLDTILEEAPGGSFIATDHTAANFRSSLWMPSLWSKTMFNMWNAGGRKNDIERAKEMYFSLTSDGKPLEMNISEDCEKRLMKIIQSVKPG